jgi:ADP-ribose pyrophosphatase
MQSNSDAQAYQEKKAKKVITPIHKGRLISIHSENYPTDLGIVHTDIVVHPGAVAIIPVNEKGEILLIKQWRRAVKEILIEIPAGTLEEGEETLECAHRELQEETGFKASTMIYLGMLYTCPGFCTEKIYLYLGKDLTASSLPCDDTEAIDLCPMTLQEALSKVESGEIPDAKTISALCLYVRWLEKEKK